MGIISNLHTSGLSRATPSVYPCDSNAKADRTRGIGESFNVYMKMSKRVLSVILAVLLVVVLVGVLRHARQIQRTHIFILQRVSSNGPIEVKPSATSGLENDLALPLVKKLESVGVSGRLRLVGFTQVKRIGRTEDVVMILSGPLAFPVKSDVGESSIVVLSELLGQVNSIPRTVGLSPYSITAVPSGAARMDMTILGPESVITKVLMEIWWDGNK